MEAVERLAIARVHVSATIPPQTMKYIECKLDEDLEEGIQLELQPQSHTEKEMDILAPRIFTTPEKGMVLIPFTNFSDQRLRMRKGLEVADAREGEVVATILNAQTAREALEDLYAEPDNAVLTEPAVKEPMTTEKQ